MTPKEKLIEKIKDDILVGDDGFYVYWPTKSGYFTEHSLRLIAEVLEEKNKPWQKEMDRYFNNES